MMLLLLLLLLLLNLPLLLVLLQGLRMKLMTDDAADASPVVWVTSCEMEGKNDAADAPALGADQAPAYETGWQ